MYEKFIQSAKYPPPKNWPHGKMPRQWSQLPVTGVSYKDAAAYAKWARKRLPTEEEWEIAASWDGKMKRIYPWGDKFIEGNANIATDKLAAAGGQARDMSPMGVLDMAGNAAEWTATENKIGKTCVVRGGSADKKMKKADARTSRRAFLPQTTTGNFLGFRCAKDAR
jgi:formylglycine-generating enzyme required for sulfatase activity